MFTVDRLKIDFNSTNSNQCSICGDELYVDYDLNASFQEALYDLHLNFYGEWEWYTNSEQESIRINLVEKQLYHQENAVCNRCHHTYLKRNNEIQWKLQHRQVKIKLIMKIERN